MNKLFCKSKKVLILLIYYNICLLDCLKCRLNTNKTPIRRRVSHVCSYRRRILIMVRPQVPTRQQDLANIKVQKVPKDREVPPTSKRSDHSLESMSHHFRLPLIIGVSPKLTQNFQGASLQMHKTNANLEINQELPSPQILKMVSIIQVGRTKREIKIISKTMARMQISGIIQILKRFTQSKVLKTGLECRSCQIKEVAQGRFY